MGGKDDSPFPCFCCLMYNVPGWENIQCVFVGGTPLATPRRFQLTMMLIRHCIVGHGDFFSVTKMSPDSDLVKFSWRKKVFWRSNWNKVMAPRWLLTLCRCSNDLWELKFSLVTNRWGSLQPLVLNLVRSVGNWYHNVGDNELDRWSLDADNQHHQHFLHLQVGWSEQWKIQRRQWITRWWRILRW